MKIADPNNEGQEIEVFTAEELAAKITEAETPLKEKLTVAETAAAARAREFAAARGKFQELTDEQYAKLDAANKVIYDNQKLMAEQSKQLGEADQKAYNSAVLQAIVAKVGNDPKIIEKVKAMYGLVNIEDVTPEGIQQRVSAAVGALGQTEPDLLKSLGQGPGGAYMPPVVEKKEESFADTPRGKAMAAAIGIPLEPPKKAEK